jgi:hypothetical protein
MSQTSCQGRKQDVYTATRVFRLGDAGIPHMTYSHPRVRVRYVALSLKCVYVGTAGVGAAGPIVKTHGQRGQPAVFRTAVLQYCAGGGR